MEDEDEKTHCITYGKNGVEDPKPKRKFRTLDDAILHAKKLNSRPTQLIKLVGYKCKFCHHYHIGRNGTVITEKYRNKLTKEIKILEAAKKLVIPEFKIVGKIDLSKIDYRSKKEKRRDKKK